MRKLLSFCLLYFIFSLPTYAGYFESSVRHLLSEKLGDDIKFDIKFESQAKLNKILVKESDVDSVILNFFSPESRSFKALVTFNGDNSAKIELFGKFEPYFEIPIASRFIKFGEEITAGDIKLIKARRIKSEDIFHGDISKIFGMQTKTNIPNGQVIKLSMLKKPPVIKENDPVTLLYSADNISLKTTGIALAPGAIGEKIRVKNEKTGIVVFGEIIDKNIVKVNSPNEK